MLCALLTTLNTRAQAFELLQSFVAFDGDEERFEQWLRDEFSVSPRFVKHCTRALRGWHRVRCLRVPESYEYLSRRQYVCELILKQREGLLIFTYQTVAVLHNLQVRPMTHSL